MSEIIKNQFESVIEVFSKARQELDAAYQATLEVAVKRARKKQRQIRVMYSMLNGNGFDNTVGGLA